MLSEIPRTRGATREVSRALVVAAAASTGLAACLSPVEARAEADRAAHEILRDEQQRLFGRDEDFTIETPADTLRRRLLLEQDLPNSGPTSLGSKDVEPIEQWPDKTYFEDPEGVEPPPWHGGETLHLGLLDALQAGARSSREYQTRKEGVFQAALALDLERDRFRRTWTSVLGSAVERDGSTDPATTGSVSTGNVGVTQRLKNGALMSVNLALDLVQLLTHSEDGALGLLGDASISIPLLRGSGEFVVTEPLTQAEREVVYALYDFERFKRTFAVQVATEYYAVLQLGTEIEHAETNYRWLRGATRRARRLADAQQLDRIQLDQTLQDELDARDAWVVSISAHERRLDEFKQLLGLPVDARIELDARELDPLTALAADLGPEPGPEDVPADAPIEIVPPGAEGAGPFELDPRLAVSLALEHRLDLRIAVGRVFDAQRAVAVNADLLRADLALFGRAQIGESRDLASADQPNAELNMSEGRYSVAAVLGLPLERTLERNIYRNTLIGFEQSVRFAQELEDTVKFEVRDDLRVLREARERVRIQARSVRLAEQRVESTSRFLEVGQAEARDVLEAQSDLVEAKDALTQELVRHRVAELELQSDLDLLQVDSKGLWVEVDPGQIVAE